MGTGIDAQERQALAEAVREASAGGPRDFLEDTGRPSRDTRLWKVLSDQMGLTALLVDEDDGGAGAGVAEVAVVLEELARKLAVVPALSSLATATALLRTVDGDAAAPLLGALAAGETTASVAWPAPESSDASPSLVGTRLNGDDASVAVHGSCGIVLDAEAAVIVLAPVTVEDEIVVVAVDLAQDSVSRTSMTGLDLTRGVSAIEFDGAVGTNLGTVDLPAARDLALVFIAAEQVGVAQYCHDEAVRWARERVQFDRPIGQFQAIKHQLVDLLMHVELARSALDVAVAAADAYLGDPGAATARSLRVAASVAKARCGESATIVADQSLHILGGIGFTWEHDAHLYLRRAKSLEVLLGTPAAHRTRFATTLLEEAANG